MPKPFLTYPQQIQKLKDKNLTITDDAAATILIRGSNGIFDHILTSRADAQRRGVVFHFIMCDSIRRKRLQGKRPFP